MNGVSRYRGDEIALSQLRRRPLCVIVPFTNDSVWRNGARKVSLKKKKTENFTISTPMAQGLVLQNGLIERGDRTRNDF